MWEVNCKGDSTKLHLVWQESLERIMVMVGQNSSVFVSSPCSAWMWLRNRVTSKTGGNTKGGEYESWVLHWSLKWYLWEGRIFVYYGTIFISSITQYTIIAITKSLPFQLLETLLIPNSVIIHPLSHNCFSLLNLIWYFCFINTQH